ncbi:heparan-alpha-glucosaminide N-acetyltransferase isoform X2 [Belonocnema kinseyi]|uniref:heparan-alpha-glucosaminide N-acetyltransferase isoform X2 n=1 Tax=Belonocnema kinseyi TaxID=2817044 RepID=UPI00143DFA68|nr:heparan-alpha-glucosaminide N-acetyltransferase isoform X2 [Belonocnema kinseyi]
MDVENCDYDELAFDEACVLLRSNSNSTDLWLYSLSFDCIACPYTRIGNIFKETNLSVKFNTAKSHRWKILRSNGSEDYLSESDMRNTLYHFLPRMEQFGFYQLTVNDTNCDFKTIKRPTNSYTPLAITIGIIVTFLIGLLAVKWCTNRMKKKFEKNFDVNRIQERSGAKPRVQSIDTVRGISILFMIFVNDGAGGYPVLEHATWDGLLVGDLVFPCFMWIMGVCIPIALSSQLSRGISRLSICSSIVKRSLMLFFIGLCLNTIGTEARLEEIRIFGVLQRFGVAYLVTGIIYTSQCPRKKKEAQRTITRSFMDVITLWSQWLMILCIVLIHCLVTLQFWIPGCPKGYLGPGGRHADGKYTNCTGGAAGFIDRNLLGVRHIYKQLAIRSVYGSGPFDPEGILGCLTSIFQVFLGVQCGQTLIYHMNWKGRIIRWISWALVLGSLGSILHFKHYIPVNKNLWSLSFVLVTSCFSLCLLTACYLFIDVAKIWRGGPFRIPGMNALAMYIGHQICYQILPFNWKIGEMKTHGWLLAESLWGVALWIVVSYILHRKKIYITL